MVVLLLNDADAEVAIPVVQGHSYGQILVFKGLKLLNQLADGLATSHPAWDWMARVIHEAQRFIDGFLTVSAEIRACSSA